MRYSKVTRRIWGDAKFKSLSQDAKLLFFRLLTAPESTTIPGVILVRKSALAEDMGWTAETVSKRFGELFRNGIAMVDWDAGLVWLPNAIAHNSPENPNMVKGWAAPWKELPDSDLIAVIHQGLSAHMETLSEQFRNGFETVSKRLPKPSRNQEQEQEQEQEQDLFPPIGSPPSAEPRVRRGSRLPADWVPSPDTLAALSTEGCTNAKDALPSFRDYWNAVPGAKGVKLDWEGTYRNWCRRDSGTRNIDRSSKVQRGLAAHTALSIAKNDLMAELDAKDAQEGGYDASF